MSSNPHRCVIDSAGYYVDFVLLVEQQDETMAPYAYEMKPGETLIEASPPSNMITPHWNGKEWEETATPEEIEAAEAEKARELGINESQTATPTLAERVEAMEDALLALALGGGENV